LDEVSGLMSNEGLSPAVKQFLREHIQSVQQIEILALMHGARGRDWTARALDETLRSSEQSIARRLAEFTRGGLLMESGEAEKAYR